jgi:hypothetical protein
MIGAVITRGFGFSIALIITAGFLPSTATSLPCRGQSVFSGATRGQSTLTEPRGSTVTGAWRGTEDIC